MPSAESDKYTQNMVVVLSLVALGVGIAAAILSTVILSKSVLKPVFSAVRAGLHIAENINNGVLTQTDTGYKPTNDEMGDFTAKNGVEYVGDFIEIKHSFEQINSGLGTIIGGIEVSAQEVLQGSGEISEGAQSLAEGSTRQAAAIEQLSASVNEITVKVNKSAENARNAGEVSEKTGKKIADQNLEVQYMLTAMEEIKSKSDQIGNIINAIDDIAFQTNILALNAAIEASRAGEAGKGFAVVANEVRNLAAKSAESAKQTGELINVTVAAVQKGTDIAQQTADTMKEVTAFTEQTHQYIEEIVTAANEEANSIEIIKSGIEDISNVVQTNTATAEQTASACAALNQESENLKQRIDQLKINN